MKDCVDAARAAEQRRAARRHRVRRISAWPISTTPALSVVTVADGDRTQGRSGPAMRSSTSPGRHKERFHLPGRAAGAGASRAPKPWPSSNGGPILLLDHADNCASGATQDTMYVLKEALRQGLTGIAVGPVRDPEAVGEMIRPASAPRVTLKLGGKMDMPAIDAQRRAAGSDRRRARDHRWRIHHHRPAVPGHALLHGSHRGARYRHCARS